MSCYQIYVGQQARIQLTLTRHGNLVNLANTATVTVAITNERTGVPELSGIEASPTETGADWSQGVITITLTAAQTNSMDPGVYGVALRAVDGTVTYVADDPYAVQVEDLGMTP